MPVVLIPCPQCGKSLKLPDRSLLGRPGRCPACRHRFLLEEPDEVELELADPPPLVGTGAKWVPDEPPVSRTLEASGTLDRGPVPPPPLASAPAEEPPPIPLVTEPAAAGSTLDILRKRRRRHRRTGIVVGGLVGSGLAVVVLAIVFARPADPPPRPAKPRPAASPAYAAEQTVLRDNLALAREASPTSGEPIRLLYVPTGANVIVHLRPAELWSDEPAAQEFRACFGEPLMPAIEGWIREFCRFEPREIEELLVCFLLPVRGEPPKIAAVIRTLESQRRSQLLMKYPGDLNERHGYPVYVGERQAFAFSEDRQTIAIAPNDFDATAELAASMLRKQPAATKDGLLALLAHTDRERHITLVFQPDDVRLHREFLIPEAARPAAEVVLDWLGDDVETVAWSLHRGDERFFSQIYARNHHAWTPAQLHADLRRKMQRLPRELYEAVRKMRPQSVGARTLIGRFPAMVKVYSLQTLFATGPDPRRDRFVQLTTVLPERAAPNLVLAALLAWDESTRTDFSQAAPAEPSQPRPPETVLERLRKPIEIDFNREPLEAAFQYIGRETSVTIEIDGKALEDAGMTRNMPQTQALGTVPAIRGVEAILARYDTEGLCIVIDERGKTVTVTTKSAAAQRGETPHPIAM